MKDWIVVKSAWRRVRRDGRFSRAFAVVVLALLIVMCAPELRAMLLMANALGLDLVILLLGLQFRLLLHLAALDQGHVAHRLCRAGATTLRLAARGFSWVVPTVTLAPSLFVLSNSYWCVAPLTHESST